jgi:hypothetical protein
VFVEEISKDTPSDTIIVDDEKVYVRIGDAITHSTIIKNVVIFTINSTVGTKGTCFYEISIIYFRDEPLEQVSDDINYVKLDDNWYIKKELFWGT